MITLRIDVDYAFPSRTKSFLYTFLRRKSSKNYLVYAKRLADLINQSSLDVKAYWFFTHSTLPDNEILFLLSTQRHEIGLHVVNDASKELAQLEKVSPKPIEFFTIHGTERLFGQLIWHRCIGQKQANIPEGFGLQSFHTRPTECLDWLCYKFSNDVAFKVANEWIDKNCILEVHPDWLLKSGGRQNNRGPYIEVLRRLLFPCPDS